MHMIPKNIQLTSFFQQNKNWYIRLCVRFKINITFLVSRIKDTKKILKIVYL